MKILIFTIFLMTIILNVQADNKNNNLIEEVLFVINRVI